LNYNLIIIAE